MGNYLLTYHGGTPSEDATEDQRNAVMAAWEAWMEGLGTSLVDRGAPTGAINTLNPDGSTEAGGGANPVTGYSLIAADSMAKALELATACPHLEAGGTIEVAEAIDM